MGNDLLELARARIASGQMPDSLYATSLGGPSIGNSCVVCLKAIAPGAPEIEVKWTKPGQKDRSLVMHPLCFSAWSRSVREVAARA
jgi:hypothetical protein